jgi:hypothetical protein
VGTLSFHPVSNGLYRAVGDVSPAIAVYWVLLDGSPPSGDLDPAATWASYGGCHAFVPAGLPVTDPAAFVAAIGRLCGPPAANVRGVAWVPDPAAVAATAIWVTGVIGGTPGVAMTVEELALPFGNIGFNASKNAVLIYDPSPPVAPGTPSIAIGAASQGVLGLVRQGLSINLAPAGSSAAIPLAGPSAGAVVFQANWDRGELYNLFADDPASWDLPPGAEVRFFQGPAGAEQTLRYPVFLGQAPSQEPAQQLVLDVMLDPLHPWDPAQTVLALDVAKFGGGGPVLPTCPAFAATDGSVLELVPHQGAGLALARRPQGASKETAAAYTYLTPTGTFTVQPPNGDPSIRHLMCGLTGTEYLLLAPDATVELVPQGAAYAPAFTAPSGGSKADPRNPSGGGSGTDPCSPGGGGSSGADLRNPAGGNGSDADPCNPAGGDQPVDPDKLLNGQYTTAWLRVQPPTTPVAAIDRGYTMQPASSVYYRSSNTSAYPPALGCRVSTLAATNSPPIPLPLAPYGNVWATGAGQLPSAAALRAFESQIVSPARLATAPKDMADGPTIFEVSSHAPVDGGAAMTPDGLLAQLNTAASGRPGTFAALQLAKSPNTTPLLGAEELAFTGSPVLAPELSYAFTNDNLFMVATDGTALGGLGTGFKNVIQMGEWTFRLDVGYSADQTTTPTTILLFKLTTAFSVVDLVANTAYWQGWQTFIDPDPAKVKVVQSQLNTLLCAAKPNGSNELFADFWAKATDPQWTGILAMSCGLDAADLPLDLQDLLGGLAGELRAHHFGVTVNRVKGADSSSWAIDTSSLFGLIHYEMDYGPPPPPPLPPPTQFAFQVLRLNVLFENSTLAHFDSRIAVTIPELFSTEVVLPPCGDPHVPAGYNVIEIDGVYQRHGDSGTVVFDTTSAQVFSFKTPTAGFRVLREAYVTDAALVPISSSTDGTTITVRSCLALSGLLVFAEDVSAAAQGKPSRVGDAPAPPMDPGAADTQPPAMDPVAADVSAAARGGGSLVANVPGPPMDLFAYGDTTTTPSNGLGFASYAIAMTTSIKSNVGEITAIVPDLSRLQVTPATSLARPESILAALPVRLTAFLAQPDSSGWPVTFDGASRQPFAASCALRFRASLGSLGALSSLGAGFEVDLVLGWEAARGAGNDQIWLLMVPPAGMHGGLGFGLQGVLETTFTSVALERTTWPASGSPSWTVYSLSFVNVNVELLGIKMLPGNGAFRLFADPSQGSTSNIGWLMSLWSPVLSKAA